MIILFSDLSLGHLSSIAGIYAEIKEPVMLFLGHANRESPEIDEEKIQIAENPQGKVVFEHHLFKFDHSMFTKFGKTVNIMRTRWKYADIAIEHIVKYLKEREIAPTKIIMDFFSVHGYVISHLFSADVKVVCYLPPFEEEDDYYNQIVSEENDYRASWQQRFSYTLPERVPGVFHYIPLTLPKLLRSNLTLFEMSGNSEKYRARNFICLGEIGVQQSLIRPQNAKFGDICGAKRNLVFVSFGSMVSSNFWNTYKNRIQLFLKSLIKAASEFHDALNVVISLGDGAKSLIDLPENVFVFEYVDQMAVLKKCKIFVTHCGLNSLNEALHRVDFLVSVPFYGDQVEYASFLEKKYGYPQVNINEFSEIDVQKLFKNLFSNIDMRKNPEWKDHLLSKEIKMFLGI